MASETGVRGCGGCKVTCFQKECPLLVSFQGTAWGRGAAWEVGGLAGISGISGTPTPWRAGKPPPAAWARCSHRCWGHVLLPKGLCAPHLLVLSVSLSGDLSLPPRPLGGAWSGRRGRGQRQKTWLQGDHHGGHICVPSWPPPRPGNLSGPRRCFWCECSRRPPELGFSGGFPLLGALHLIASGPPNGNEVFVLL